MKKELAVAALQNGTVIDHIPPQVLFQCVKILGIEKLHSQLTIGNNLTSGKHGYKGIIKVADVFFPEALLNRIAFIAPDAVINIIRDFEVIEKRKVELPSRIIGIVKCENPKCITNNEPMKTRFDVIDPVKGVVKCCYCDHTTDRSKATIL
ncbi:MAG: aspartate carbamoyltransferase regulatory subunit [Muribaculaceae bacterium]|nr:aspartate carbamoyltransferase regulatory subunit [Muribaculaceae bacterium]